MWVKQRRKEARNYFSRLDGHAFLLRLRLLLSIHDCYRTTTNGFQPDWAATASIAADTPFFVSTIISQQVVDGNPWALTRLRKLHKIQPFLSRHLPQIEDRLYLNNSCCLQHAKQVWLSLTSFHAHIPKPLLLPLSFIVLTKTQSSTTMFPDILSWDRTPFPHYAHHVILPLICTINILFLVLLVQVAQETDAAVSKILPVPLLLGTACLLYLFATSLKSRQSMVKNAEPILWILGTFLSW